ncbi:MAG: molecular chaperone DnaK [Burkholderiales bacterium]|nr:molecular chaperone DnaK [Burkholderiales bacterium]
MRIRLDTELSQTIAAIEQAKRSVGTVELDQSSVGRVSRIDAFQQQELAKVLQERLNVRKRKLEAALNRVELGAYGLCCACQCDVDPARLDADPAAVFCSVCVVGQTNP